MARLETSKIIAIKAMVLQGKSIPQIAKSLGVSLNTVGRYRTRLKNGYVPPVDMKDKKAAIIQSLHEEIPPKEIARKHGVSAWKVYNTLNELQDKGLFLDYKTKVKVKQFLEGSNIKDDYLQFVDIAEADKEPEKLPQQPEKLPENPTIETTYETYGDTRGGKTLLEEFAGIALNGILANVSTDIKKTGNAHIVENAFQLGFEMLKQAEKYRERYKNAD